MAYRHARFGVSEFGATVAGLTNKPIDVRVAGTRQNPMRTVQFRITGELDGGASQCFFRLRGARPQMFQDIVFLRGTAPSDVYWGGTILTTKAMIEGEVDPQYDCTAIDWTWLMDRYKLVIAKYQNMAVNAILADLLARFTNGRFRPGYCPSSLGIITGELRFDGVPVSQAVTRLAKAANAYARVRANRRVDIAIEFLNEGNALTLDDTTPVRSMRHEEAGAQIANRVLYLGRSTQSTTDVAVGAATIPIDECSLFSAAGGFARSGLNNVTYTGLSGGSGPGTLTGCTGITTAIASGDDVRVLAIAQDAAAQAALATLLGSGRSGIAEVQFEDDALTDGEARARASAYLAFWKQTATAIEFGLDEPHYAVGKLITASMMAPVVISGDYRIQSTTTSYDDDIDADLDMNPRLTTQVSARVGRRSNVFDVLVTR